MKGKIMSVIIIKINFALLVCVLLHNFSLSVCLDFKLEIMLSPKQKVIFLLHFQSNYDLKFHIIFKHGSIAILPNMLSVDKTQFTHYFLYKKFRQFKSELGSVWIGLCRVYE